LTVDAAISRAPDDPSVVVDAPGPELPWWRQLGLVRRDFLGFLASSAERYGDIFCIQPAPSTRIFVLNSVDLVSEVLTRRADEFTKSKQTRFVVGKFLGNGLVLSEGDQHARQRRLLQPTFGSKELTVMARDVVSETEALLKSWDSSQTVDIEPVMTALSLRVIRRFLVGDERLRHLDGVDTVGSKSGEHSDDSEVFRTLAEAIGGRFRSMPLPAWIPTRRNLRERRAVRRVDELVTSLLAQSRTDGHSATTLLGTLGTLLDNGQITATEVRDQLVTMLFAGHETVAKVLSWTLYLVARNSDVQDEIYAEVSGLAAGRQLDITDLRRLKQTTNAVRESMRLYPPVWVFDRSPKHSLNLGGLLIHPRDTIYVSPYLLHRQGRYFADPLRFNPSRFEADTTSTHTSAYMPFGAGHRGCIGQSMAVVETVLMIATIVQSYELRTHDDDDIRPFAGATLGPTSPIRLSLTRRTGLHH